MNYAFSVLEKLNSLGYKAYLVGGCVRDFLCGRVPQDFDIATDALPDAVIEAFSQNRHITAGLKHGTVGIIFENQVIEVTTFREETSYSDLRRPDSVIFTDSLEKDLARRDFTVNAMAMDINHQITDIFCGKSDIKSKIIRSVGDPEKRFNEDALRILRCLRFAAAMNFTIDSNTLSAANNCAYNICHIAPERITAEILKMLDFDCSYAIKSAIPIWKAVFPSLNSSSLLKNLDCLSRCDCAVLRLAVIFSFCDDNSCLLKLDGKTKKLIKYLLNNDLKSIKNIRRQIALNGFEFVSALAKFKYALGGSYAGIVQVEHCLSKPNCISDLDIDGSQLEHLGYKGMEIKNVLNFLLEACILEKCANTNKILIKYLKKYELCKNAHI